MRDPERSVLIIFLLIGLALAAGVVAMTVKIAELRAIEACKGCRPYEKENHK